MSFISIPETNTTIHGVQEADGLPCDVCNGFIAMHKDIDPKSARVGTANGDQVVSTIRDVRAYPLTQNQADKIIQPITDEVNQTFNYDIVGLIEHPAILRYTAPSNGYDWHVDIAEGPASLRKISIIINLNDDYEGGDFELFSEGGASRISLAKGQIIAFSSFLPHRITPVTKGERWSIVAWISGPCFR